MLAVHLRSGIAHVGQALRMPEEFAVRWNDGTVQYQWWVWASLMATAILPTSSYVGIAGAANGLIPGHNEMRNFSSPNMGELSGAGVLGANSKVGFKDISDGSSNALIVGEQSGLYYTASGQKKDWRSSG